MPAMVWVTLCSGVGSKGSSFFRDLYPCNFKQDWENRAILEQFIKLIKDTDNVCLDQLLQKKKKQLLLQAFFYFEI